MEAKVDITEVPFNTFIGIKRPQRPDLGTLTLEGAPRYHNHLGTMHAAAQFALAEACSGEYLLSRFARLAEGHLAVVRRVEVKFRNPAQGEMYAKAHVPEEKIDEFIADVTGKGRAFLTINVDVLTADKVTAMRAAFEWYVQKLER
jgi:acyl-coenzyme A thioesterase PaaI-like protein